MSAGMEAEVKIPSEGRAPLSNRLRREGRWAEAAAFKDGVISELRSRGINRKDAQEEARRQMAEQYPPLPKIGAEPPPVLDPDGIADLLPDSSPDTFLKDATWVYNNIARNGVDVGKAPTAGAVGLLQWARSNVDDFYKNVWPKALGPATKQKPEEDDETNRNLEHVKSLEEMLR